MTNDRSQYSEDARATLERIDAVTRELRNLQARAADIAWQVGRYEHAWRVSDADLMRLTFRQLDEMCSTPELRLIRGACVVAAAASRDGSGGDHLAYPGSRRKIIAEYVADDLQITREELSA